MTDGPVLGQVGFPRGNKTLKIEIIGELTPLEWEEFVACVRECARRFPGKIRILGKAYKVPLKSLRKLKLPPRRGGRGR